MTLFLRRVSAGVELYATSCFPVSMTPSSSLEFHRNSLTTRCRYLLFHLWRFLRNNDVIFTSCVCWDGISSNLKFQFGLVILLDPRDPSWHTVAGLSASDNNNQMIMSYGLVQAVAWSITMAYTARCRHNAVNLLTNTHNRHPIARPWGRGMGCLLWLQTLMNVIPKSLQCCVQYHVMLDRFITALDCIGITMLSFHHQFDTLYLTGNAPRYQWMEIID